MQGPSVRINAEVSTDNALVVACFPSVGMVSSVVAHFLIEHLQLEFIGGVVDPVSYTHLTLPTICSV